MIKYVLFAGKNAYPSGGMLDCIGVFDNFGPAVDAFDADEWEWGHVGLLTNDGQLFLYGIYNAETGAWEEC